MVNQKLPPNLFSSELLHFFYVVFKIIMYSSHPLCNCAWITTNRPSQEMKCNFMIAVLRDFFSTLNVCLLKQMGRNNCASRYNSSEWKFIILFFSKLIF